MIIKIDALDTLFFRDGRPFTMGEDTWANSIFPCYPSVIYGALRTVYFSENTAELDKANGPDDPTVGLEIKSIHLEADDMPYWPLPLDYVKDKNQVDNEETVFLLKRERETVISNYSCVEILSPDKNKKVESIAGGLARKREMKNYLDNNIRKSEFIPVNLSDYITLEPKIGIGRNRTTRTTSDEQKLYRVEMQRPENESGEQLSLVVKFNGLDIPPRGFMKLGGEGKATYYKETNETTIEAPKLGGNIFKIYLATPAIFNHGWLPLGLRMEKNLIGTYKELKLKLLTAAVGKYISIGGFDMKKKKSKIMYRAVPAGSVYYFKLLNGDMSEVISIFHNKSISDIQAKEGFGISFVGEV